MENDEAVDKALKDMPDDYEIKDFLLANQAEVKSMCLTEYNEAETMQMIKDEGREEGREEGESNIIDLYTWLKSEGRDDDAEAIMKKENESLRAQLYEEFHTTVKQ
jgi:predicted transposase YdaD